MTFNRLLKQQCAVLRQDKTAAPDDWGGTSSAAWPTIADGIPCRRYGVDGTEIVRPDGTRAIVTTHIDLPAGTDVTPRDRIAIGMDTYDVIAISDSGAGHHLVARAREVA